MQAGGFEVDIDGLYDIGGKVAEAAATLQQTLRAARTGLAPAAQPGSAAAAAAKTAEQVWTTGLQRLADQIDAYSNSLVTAAREYRAADEANAQQLRRSGAGAKR